MLVLVLWSVPIVQIQRRVETAEVYAGYDDLRRATPEPATVRRIWVDLGDDGISGLVVMVDTDRGPVLTGAIASHRERLPTDVLPREGDPACVWRSLSGHTFVQVRRRRVGQR